MNPIKLIVIALVLAVCESVKCPPGSYILKAGVCRACPKGTFQSRANRRGCRPCPPNKIAATEGSTECSFCPENSKPSDFQHACVCVDGTYRRDENCVPCEPGTFFGKSEGYATCIACTPGYYQPDSGQFKCLECPKGKRSGPGAAECVKCGKNEGFTPDENKCEKCEAGSYHDPDIGCSECFPDTYKPKAGLGPCVPCPRGTFSKRGATKCTRCPKGTALFKNGKCGSCRAGWYLSEFELVCKKCGINQFTPHRNVRKECYFCGGRKFSLEGATKCIRCAKNKFLLRNGKCGKCGKGYIYNGFDVRCEKCEVNEFTRNGMGYCESCPSGTYAFPGSTTCFPCGRDKALILKKRKCLKCAAGQSYSRFRAECQPCSEGWIKKRAGLGDCIPCPRDMTSNAKFTKCVPL